MSWVQLLSLKDSNIFNNCLLPLPAVQGIANIQTKYVGRCRPRLEDVTHEREKVLCQSFQNY